MRIDHASKTRRTDMNAFPGRSPTARERDYLSALAAGVRRPGISGKAGHLCRRFGWCEFIYLTSGGEEVARSALPPRMDAIAIVRAGYRAIGFTLTPRGRMALAASAETPAKGHPVASLPLELCPEPA
jgi:hypothetical protein